MPPRKKATAKKAPVKKAVVSKKKEIDPMELPVFLNRMVGKVKVVGYSQDKDGKSVKVGEDGNHYYANTDKKVPKTRMKA